MAEPSQDQPTEAQRRAAEFLTRPKPDMETWWVAREAEAKVGDVMRDGSIFAGVLPETGERVLIATKEMPRRGTFNEAAKYAKELDAHGHNDWRIPTLEELNVIYQNVEQGALRNLFNRTVESVGNDYPGWYMSSTPYKDIPMWIEMVCFSDGHVHHTHQESSYGHSARPVRVIPWVKL
jgi:hypothetical protein